jgi:putative serine protease PepD
MTDEQRGHTRPEGDVAHDQANAATAGDSSTQQTTTLIETGGDGTSYPASPYANGRGSMYGTPGYAQHVSGGEQQDRAYGSPAYGPYASQGPTYGAAGMPPAAGGPGEPPHGPGNTAVIGGERPPRRNRTMTGIVAAALIAGIVGGGAGFGGAYALLDHGSSGGGATLTGQPATNASTKPVDGSVAAAAAKASPSTVDIRVQTAQGAAEGSGVILTSDGDVLTNNHVVAGSSGQIQVTLSDGTQHAATLVGTSPSYDLAVIKVQGVSGLTAATLGQSTGVQVGQQVVAIGSPQGLTGTVTTGIVSALNRTVAVKGADGSGVVYNGLQTDAPINQGNSGGPLVNLDGQVVGINSAIATAGQSSGSVGLGFAIPVDQARRVAQEIMDSGHATKPVLGVLGSTGGSATGSTSNGATIEQVTAGGPAAAAGLAPGDVVTKVGDATVSDFSDLIARIGAYSPGQKVTLTLSSGKTVDVTLGSTQDNGATTSSGGSTQSEPQQQQSPFGFGNPFGRGGN